MMEMAAVTAGSSCAKDAVEEDINRRAVTSGLLQSFVSFATKGGKRSNLTTVLHADANGR